MEIKVPWRRKFVVRNLMESIPRWCTHDLTRAATARASELGLHLSQKEPRKEKQKEAVCGSIFLSVSDA